MTSRQMILKTGWSQDPQQRMIQKLMLYGIPFSLLLSGWYFPIGVVIYWVTQNLVLARPAVLGAAQVPAAGDRGQHPDEGRQDRRDDRADRDRRVLLADPLGQAVPDHARATAAANGRTGGSLGPVQPAKSGLFRRKPEAVAAGAGRRSRSRGPRVPAPSPSIEAGADQRRDDARSTRRSDVVADSASDTVSTGSTNGCERRQRFERHQPARTALAVRTAANGSAQRSTGRPTDRAAGTARCGRRMARQTARHRRRPPRPRRVRPSRGSRAKSAAPAKKVAPSQEARQPRRAALGASPGDATRACIGYARPRRVPVDDNRRVRRSPARRHALGGAPRPRSPLARRRPRPGPAVRDEL